MEELIDCICDYVRKPYTDYAVMINGEWGSGKTYFWNNKLRSRLESLSTQDGRRFKTIYVSLYGINSLEEISKKIFMETNPVINRGLRKYVETHESEGNIIPEYAKTGIDMANLFGTMQTSTDKIDFSKLFDVSNKILCFDDLERAHVDVVDILGYINNFVEHDGIKTILICNESELATKFKNTNVELKTLIATIMLDKEGKLKQELEKGQKPIVKLLDETINNIFDRANAYERIKEKLIGETFDYIPEYSYILNGMIMKFSYNEALSDFYKRNNATIINAFNKSKTRNLRILKHSLDDFEKIFNNVTRDYPNILPDILRTLLTFTIAVSFELKAGNVSKEKLKSIKDNDEYTSVIFTSKILNENNQFYLRDFDNRYFLNNNSNYKFFKFIEVYIRTRYFDEKLYHQDMNKVLELSASGKNKEKHKYVTILNGQYWKLSDFDFDTLSKEVLDEIKSGDVDFKEYVKLFCIYKYLITSGLVDISVTELKREYKLGMQISAGKCPNIDAIQNDTDFQYDKDIAWAVNQYIKIKEKAIVEKATQKATELFKNLPNNIQEFYEKMVGQYQNLPVFSEYDMQDLYSKLQLTHNYDLYNIISMLQMRYSEKVDLFKEDYESLKKLCVIIDKNKPTKEKTIKQALLENISSTIKNIASDNNIKN